MEQQPAAVFFDIDGTITDSSTGLIPSSVAPAIQALKAAGHIPIINTGRPLGHVLPEVFALGFESSVCGCGSHVIYKGKTLFLRQPSSELCRRMRELVLECGLDAIFESSVKGGFCRIRFSAEAAAERKNLAARNVFLRDDLQAEDFAFDKFVVWHTPESRFDLFCAEAGKDFSIIRRSEFFTELVPLGCSKAGGIQLLLKKLNIPKERTFAFGDSTNDAEMFREAGTAVLMGGGNPALRPLVQLETDLPCEHGIYRALVKLGLIPYHPLYCTGKE